jgi:hypothetical protein
MTTPTFETADDIVEYFDEDVSNLVGTTLDNNSGFIQGASSITVEGIREAHDDEDARAVVRLQEVGTTAGDTLPLHEVFARLVNGQFEIVEGISTDLENI